jgi:hypothetical protein
MGDYVSRADVLELCLSIGEQWRQKAPRFHPIGTNRCGSKVSFPAHVRDVLSFQLLHRRHVLGSGRHDDDSVARKVLQQPRQRRAIFAPWRFAALATAKTCIEILLGDLVDSDAST